MFLNSIDCETLGQDGMSFEKSFKILLKELMTIMLRTNMINKVE
jgi:hypothetical protein